MTGIMSAFWSMTINHPTDTDWVLVKMPRPDFIRVLIHTEEVGAEGTPHIQAWFKLQRQQRLSYVKKLFPRGHFKALTSDEYNLNSMLYAQKTDETTAGPSVIQCNPFPDPVQELLDVLREVRKWQQSKPDAPVFRDKPRETEHAYWNRLAGHIESIRVSQSPRLAKFYVSPLYAKVKATFLEALMTFLENEETDEGEDTHTTHTHTEENVSHHEDIDNETSLGEDVRRAEDEEDEGDSCCEGEEDESDSAGTGSECSEDGDCSDF